MKLLVLVWLLSSVLTSCTTGRLAAQVADAPFVEPHTACSACHSSEKPKGTTAAFPAGTDPSTFCLNCHNYRVNHHPVDVTPARPVQAAYPLFLGRITCLTCHEIHGAPKQGNSALLRGGPHQDRRTICFQCHTSEQYAGINPHRMLAENGSHRTVNGRPVCLQCHELEPDPTIDEANTVLFRADIGFLCLRCHPPMHSETLNRHFLKVPPAQVLSNMSRPEVLEKYHLPLVPRGRITCSTCHNPHQAGVLLAGPVAAGTSSSHMLRDDDLCQGCHNK
jgi:predicted CXXCH cytochrome family protein